MKRFLERVWWIGWRIGAAAAVGVAVTLAVAFTGAVLDSALDFGGMAEHERYLRETNRWWDAVHAMGSKPEYETVAAVRKIGNRDWDADLAAASSGGVSAVYVPAIAAGDAEACDVYLTGWPARCLWGAETQSHEDRVGLMDAPEWVDKYSYVRQPLPTRVWWPGMVTDVAVFGGPVLVLLCGPRMVRGWVRRRRGACVGCGYDLRGVRGICPECGAALGQRLLGPDS